MAKPNTAGSKKNTAQKGTLRKVLKYVQRHGFFMVLSILFAAITVALTLYTPILIGDAIDRTRTGTAARLHSTDMSSACALYCSPQCCKVRQRNGTM